VVALVRGPGRRCSPGPCACRAANAPGPPLAATRSRRPRVREDQKALLGDGGEDGGGHHLGLEHAVTAGCRRGQLVRLFRVRSGHRRPHALGHRHETRSPASPWVIESHSARRHGVLGHAVRSRAELGQEPRGRRGVHEVALVAIEHLRDEGTGGVDVALHVDRPHALPCLVSELHPAHGDDPGIGAEDVDRAERLFGAAMSPSTSDSLATSVVTAIAGCPSATRASATAWAPGPSRSATTVPRVPAVANASHSDRRSARPPVTTTDRPLISMSGPPRPERILHQGDRPPPRRRAIFVFSSPRSRR